MKKKLNFLILNLFLTVVTAFLLNSEIFSGTSEDFFRSHGSMGTIKLSGKSSMTLVEGKVLNARPAFHRHLE